MTDYRLVALDMDGTILTPDGLLSLRTQDAIQAIRARGVVVALATARRWTGAAPVACALDLDGPLILYDGAVVKTFPAGRLEMSYPLATHLVRQVADILEAHELQVVVQHCDEHGERMVASAFTPHPEWMKPFLDAAGADATTIAAEHIADGYPAPVRVVTFGPQPRLMAAFDDLSELPVGRQILPLGNYGQAELTVFSPEASKGAALSWLAQQLGVPLEATFAIGDGVNDVSMFRVAGASVAMGNAAPEVQAAADVVTASNDEDGAALALEHLILGVGHDLGAADGEDIA